MQCVRSDVQVLQKRIAGSVLHARRAVGLAVADDDGIMHESLAACSLHLTPTSHDDKTVQIKSAGRLKHLFLQDVGQDVELVVARQCVAVSEGETRDDLIHEFGCNIRGVTHGAAMVI